jgi:hypothetical protein
MGFGGFFPAGLGHSAKDRSLSIQVDPSLPDGFVVHSFAGDDWEDAKAYVKERLGLSISGDGQTRNQRGNAFQQAKSGDQWSPIVPVPTEASPPNPDRYCPPGFKTTGMWEYRDGDGRLICCVVRYDPAVPGAAEGKAIRPLTYCLGPGGACEWRVQRLCRTEGHSTGFLASSSGNKHGW